jgi:alcohol dehydrogenase class IV
MQPFIHRFNPARVVFGPGTFAELEREAALLGAGRAIVISTPGQRALGERALRALGKRGAGAHAGAVMHVPRDTVVAATAAARDVRADCIVAVGGGSTVGLAKAMALENPLPILAVPTTYAGSEMTSMHGITEAGVKRTGRDERVVPRSVIYDPALSVALPLTVSVTSGLNAMAHAVEGLYAPDGNPVVSLLAEEGLRAFARSLPRLKANAADIPARGEALYGAWLCGMVMGATTVGLHHKLCHTLGGAYDLPHAELHAVLLPHTLAYNARAVPEALSAMARALGCEPQRVPLALLELSRLDGVPGSLQAIGMPADGLDRAAQLAVQSPYPNPRPLERHAIRALVQRAFDGAEPDVALSA